MISDKNPLSRVTYRFYRDRIIPDICILGVLKPLSRELSCLAATKSRQGQLEPRVDLTPTEVATQRRKLQTVMCPRGRATVVTDDWSKHVEIKLMVRGVQ